MAAMAKVTSKGQITIPRSVREHLKVATGSVLIFRVEGDRIVVHPARTLLDVAGALKGRGRKTRDFAPMRRAAKAHVARRIMGRG
jgi:AbrB family looped-hinge helix DNA binding protein